MGKGKPKINPKKRPDTSGEGSCSLPISVIRKCLGRFYENKIVIGIFLVSFLIYNTYTYIRVSGDTFPTSYLPFSMIFYHDLYLEHFSNPELISGTAVPVVHMNGHLISGVPIVIPVLITPFVYLCTLGMTPDIAEFFVAPITRTASAGIIALAVCIFYLVASRFVSQKIAILSTLVFGFATSTWAISSQALWQQGMEELLLLLLIYVIVRNEEKSSFASYIFLGILSALLVFNRPPDAVLVLPVLGYIFFRSGKHKIYFAILAILAGISFTGYNWLFFGNVFGGYGWMAQGYLNSINLSPAVFVNYLGLLISPNKGLFVFSPILILAVFGYFHLDAIKNRNLMLLFRWFGPILILETFIYGLFIAWDGGYGYGPRYLTAIVPILCIYVALYLSHNAAHFRAGMRDYLKTGVIASLVIFSVAVQFIGVFYFPYLEDSHYPEPWDISNPVIVSSFNEGVAYLDTFAIQSIPPLPPHYYYSEHNSRLIQNARYSRSIGDYANATAFYHAYLRADPNAYVIWNNLGSCQAMAGDYGSALQSFNQSLAINPQFKEAESNRDFILQNLWNLNGSRIVNPT